MRLSENRRKSLNKYTKKIYKFHEKGRLDACCADHRLGYWQYKVFRGKDEPWYRLWILVDRAVRGNKVILPKELEGKVIL